jgi:hypothetical protein
MKHLRQIASAFWGLYRRRAALGTLVSFWLALGLAAVVWPALGQAKQTSAAARLQEGIEKQTVYNDCISAISIFKSLAADASAPRNLRAEALLRLAQCEEKFGSQAIDVLNRVLNEFPDQPAAKQARAELNKIKHPAVPPTTTISKIEWENLGNLTAYDTDGMRAVYLASDGNLYTSDLKGKGRRLIYRTEQGSQDRLGWLAARDLSIVALQLPAKDSRPETLAMIRGNGTGYRELAREDAPDSMLKDHFYCDLNWSWNARQILVCLNSVKGGGHLMAVPVDGGPPREVAREDQGRIFRAVFSPDGRFVAYSVWTSKGAQLTLRIFVAPVEGGGPRQVYETPLQRVRETSELFGFQALFDWTADGHDLLISDVRAGRSALYLLPVKEGSANGEPVFVRDGRIESASTTRSGTLVFAERPEHANDPIVFLADMDDNSKPGPWKRLALRIGLGPRDPWPSFSPDGSRIAYIAEDKDLSSRDVIIQSLAGSDQMLARFPSGQPACHYAHAGDKLFCLVARDQDQGATELVSIDAGSGKLVNLGSIDAFGVRIEPSGEDKHLNFKAFGFVQNSFCAQWDLQTSQNSILVPVGANPQESCEVSPDEQWLVRTAATGDGLEVRPMAGGDWKTLVSGVPELRLGQYAITPDSRWVFYHGKDSHEGDALFRVPIAGGDTQRLGDFPSSLTSGSLHVSQDGRRIMAVTTISSRYDLWVLANFQALAAK